MKLIRMTLLSLSLLAPTLAYSEPVTVPSVDVERYMGTWYEIAAFPKFFQLGCTATQAEYTLKDDGSVAVRNSCQLFTPKGPTYAVNGVATVLDKTSNAKLSVKFFNLFDGDYWILDLADDYSYAMVGAPDLDSLWILSRTRVLDDSLIAELKVKAEQQGFDVSRLKVTTQLVD